LYVFGLLLCCFMDMMARMHRITGKPQGIEQTDHEIIS